MCMKPQGVGREPGKRARENAIIVFDSSTNATMWLVMCLPRRRRCTPAPALAGMACTLPNAIAAQVRSDRQVMAIIGDGDFTMLMGKIITAVA
jgi:pyruvate dehydrogenase (quinone)